MPKKKRTTYSKSDVDLKQNKISFTTDEITSNNIGTGDFRFTSLTKFQLSGSEPAQDEGRLYIKDKDGVLYYIQATKVG